MNAKEKLKVLYVKVDNKCLQQFGFKIKDVTFNKIVDYMFAPKDSSSLAITRILFGLAMLFDITDERGGASMGKRWGEPKTCHFPLLPILTPIGMPYMALVYASLWLGALGIMLGFKFHINGPIFTACYWYLFLIEKSFWNNHSYLFGLVALLLSCTQANCYWSLDTYMDASKKKTTVAYWNYFILKYQFFILYFMAGMKKGTAEWLTGYSVKNLSEHWVFDPFKYFLTVPQTDYLVVHWFVFMFDLTVAVWMMWSYTRHVAMVFCAMFHLMNSRLFRIGMFPWVCLATMPLFYPFDWPKRFASYAKVYYTEFRGCIYNKICNFTKKSLCECRTNDFADDYSQVKDIVEIIGKDTETKDNNDKHDDISSIPKENKKTNDKFDQDNEKNDDNHERHQEDKVKDTGNKLNDTNYSKKKITILLIMVYAFIQAFLPYSHFITKGYNNWTNGLYGYSWDMMVHTWDIQTVVVKVIDNNRNEEMYIEPQLYTLNDRYTKHGDMLHQYAQCLKKNLVQEGKTNGDGSLKTVSENISIYVDIWCSMNGRFTQRMFDPKVDLLTASWSPFSKIPYLMPLLDEAVHWREDLDEIRNNVYSWSNDSDVVFFADFPGYDQEKYIPLELKNVTLTILEGIVAYEPEVTKHPLGQSFKLTKGNRVHIGSGTFNKVINIGDSPAFYMYTFFNGTGDKEKDSDLQTTLIPRLPIFRELNRRITNMVVFGNLVASNIFQLFKFSQCSF